MPVDGRARVPSHATTLHDRAVYTGGTRFERGRGAAPVLRSGNKAWIHATAGHAPRLWAEPGGTVINTRKRNKLNLERSTLTVLGAIRMADVVTGSISSHCSTFPHKECFKTQDYDCL